MKQILQSLENGKVSILEAPAPCISSTSLLIDTTTTLISSGTERMLVDFGKASYLQKARSQPEKVKMVLEKIKTDGFISTLESVRSKLQQPFHPGYCHVGVVQEVGGGCDGFKVGDRVVSNGPHADIVRVEENLCVRIPDLVDDEAAVFTVLASIGLQGIRLAQPTLGECVAVIGTGLIGLLTVQLLQAQGCRVLAIDLDDEKLQLARQFGAEICNPSRGGDPVAAGLAFSQGYGVDAVLITASTKSNDPVAQAAKMSRKRGRIVLVGVSGLELNRTDFYEKELSFQVSCSYGPGRHDPNYEQKGLDYPIGFVRWTEKRNFEAVLELMASQRLNVKPLITHRFVFEEAPKAYQLLTEDKAALGILLEYPDISNRVSSHAKCTPLLPRIDFNPQKAVVGFIGAGNYASRQLIPAFKSAQAQLHTIVSSGGVNSVIHGQKAGFLQASTDVKTLLANEALNTVVIVTRHDTHAALVTNAISAGKHVFVEKPLAINLEELAQIEAAYLTAVMMGKDIRLMVGFNRRFSPLTQKMKWLLESNAEPKSFIMTINAGSIPLHHWTQDKTIGGGRIIGEACHFIDLMRFLAGCEITSIHARCIGGRSEGVVNEDKATILLGFADGSMGTIHYLANGAASFPKERIEVFSAGRVLQLDNFRALRGFGFRGFKKIKLWQQDKGQTQCVQAFLQCIEEGKPSPIPFSEIIEVTRVAIEAAESMHCQ